MMLRCEECDAVFAMGEAEVVEQVSVSEYFGALQISRDEVLTCPVCGCDELEDEWPETEGEEDVIDSTEGDI